MDYENYLLRLIELGKKLEKSDAAWKEGHEKHLSDKEISKLRMFFLSDLNFLLGYINSASFMVTPPSEWKVVSGYTGKLATLNMTDSKK